MKIEDLLSQTDIHPKPPLRSGDYQFEEVKNDPRFGNIQVLRPTAKARLKQAMIMKEKITFDKNSFHKDVFQAKERMRLNHPNILKMVGYETRLQDEQVFTVKGFYEYPENDLKSDIEQKRAKGEDFEGWHLLNLISQLSQPLGFLQMNKMIHGNVRPKFISYFAEERKFKILDRLSDPSSPVQVQLNVLRGNQDVYMSPLLFGYLKNGVRRFMHNPYKSDVFSLGICVLEAGRVGDVQMVYNHEKKIINEQTLKQLISAFEEKYSQTQKLVQVLRQMLQVNEHLRPSFTDLIKTLALGEEDLQQAPQGTDRCEKKEIEVVIDSMGNQNENQIKIQVRNSVHGRNDLDDTRGQSGMRKGSGGDPGPSVEAQTQKIKNSIKQKIQSELILNTSESNIQGPKLDNAKQHHHLQMHQLQHGVLQTQQRGAQAAFFTNPQGKENKVIVKPGNPLPPSQTAPVHTKHSITQTQGQYPAQSRNLASTNVNQSIHHSFGPGGYQSQLSSTLIHQSNPPPLPASRANLSNSKPRSLSSHSRNRVAKANNPLSRRLRLNKVVPGQNGSEVQRSDSRKFTPSKIVIRCDRNSNYARGSATSASPMHIRTIQGGHHIAPGLVETTTTTTMTTTNMRTTSATRPPIAKKIATPIRKTQTSINPLATRLPIPRKQSTEISQARRSSGHYHSNSRPPKGYNPLSGENRFFQTRRTSYQTTPKNGSTRVSSGGVAMNQTSNTFIRRSRHGNEKELKVYTYVTRSRNSVSTSPNRIYGASKGFAKQINADKRAGVLKPNQHQLSSSQGKNFQTVIRSGHRNSSHQYKPY